MPRGATREVLLQAALDQFAERGFGGTSIRDLAKAAGIKESSVYKHFSSKQALFDELLAWTQDRYAAAAQAVGLRFDDPRADAAALSAVTADELSTLGLALFDFSVTDDVAATFRRLLTVEQFREPRAGELLRSYFIDTPIAYQTQLFAALIDARVLRRADPRALALGFWGPIWLLICAADASTDGGQAARAAVQAHLLHFHPLHADDDRP